MKLRLAKKILSSRNWAKKFAEMRPPYIDEYGWYVYPSWHDIPIVSKAYHRILRYYKKKGGNKCL